MFGSDGTGAPQEHIGKLAEEAWQPPPCETEDDADALINRVLSKREERQRLIDQHAKRIAAIDGEIDWLEGWALPTLEEWLERNPPKRGKSRDLPRGRAGWRTSKGGIIVDDEEAALNWAIDNAPDAITIPEPRLLKSKLPDDCPHTHRAEDKTTFYVRGPK